jgi:hypothetical protein
MSGCGYIADWSWAMSTPFIQKKNCVKGFVCEASCLMLIKGPSSLTYGASELINAELQVYSPDALFF